MLHLRKMQSKVGTYGALLFIMSVAIASRIPRVIHVQGLDNFTLAAEAFSLLNGEASFWLIHPLSYLGMFTFSGYPIGSVVLLALMLLLTGSSLEMATILHVSLFCVVSVSSTYVLMRHLFSSRTLHMLGTMLYQITPIINEFTYYTAGARMPFLAILPIFVYLLLQWNRGNKKALLQAVFVVLLLMLFHRASIALFGLLIIAALYPFAIRRIYGFLRIRNISTGRFLSGVFVIASLILPVLAILFSEVRPKNIIPAEAFRSSVLNTSTQIVSLVLDYSLFYGPLFVLSGIGLFKLLSDMWYSEYGWSKEMNEWNVLLFVFAPLLYFVTNPAYTRHFLAILVVALSVKGIMHLQSSFFRSLAGIVLCVLPSIIYFNLYSLFWRPIEPYAQLVTVSSLFLSMLYILAPTVRKALSSLKDLNINEIQFRGLIITLMVLVVTISYIDMRTVLSGDELFGRVPTQDEIDVARFIRHDLDNRDTPSIVISQHMYIEIRVAAYAQTYALADGHGCGLLAAGYVTREDAIANSTFMGFGHLMKTHIYQHRANPADLWYYLMRANWSEYNTQTLISNLRISHFIALKDEEDYFGPHGTVHDGLCLLSRTITLDPVYETDHLILYSFIT